MAMLDASLRYDTLKAPFMGHALNDLLKIMGNRYELVGSMSFTTKQEYEDCTFIDNSIKSEEIDRWTGIPVNNVHYSKIPKNNLPTWEKLLATHKEYLQEYKAYENKRKRQYPDVREQLDMLYKDIDQGMLGDNAKNSNFYKVIKQIKSENP